MWNKYKSYQHGLRAPEALCFRIIRPFEAWNTLFLPVHGPVGLSDQPWPFSACPAVRLRALPENAWREWPQLLHVDVSWPSYRAA